MATPAGQAKAQALNAKLEVEARMAIDGLERQFMRKHAKSYHTCAAKCYDDRSPEALEACVSSCELPHQKASAVMQQEVGNFQNRLSRAMQDCQDNAREMMRPGYENDAKAMAKVEDVLLGCMEKTVSEYIGKLKPLKQRVADQMKTI